MVKTALPLQGCRFAPWLGILHAVQSSQKKKKKKKMIQILNSSFVVVQSLSCVQLIVTP